MEVSDSFYFNFYPSDWLSGTRGLTAAETGIYITLIAMMYEREAPLDFDAKRLSRLCGATVAAFEKALDGLVSEGKIINSDVGLWNTRVQKEVEKRSEKRKQAARNISARWEKSKQKQVEADTGVIRTPYGSDTSQSQSQSQIEEEERNAPDGARVVGLFTADETPARDERSEQFERFWKAYPEKKAKPAARKAFAKQIKDGANPEEIITGAERYAARLHNVQPGQFVPHPKYPQGWLNERRWEDEPAPEAKAARRYFGEVVR